MVVTGNGIVGAPKSVDNRGSLKLLGPTVTKVVLESPPQKTTATVCLFRQRECNSVQI